MARPLSTAPLAALFATLLAALPAPACCARAQAQDGVAPPAHAQALSQDDAAPAAGRPDLYLEAMRAISDGRRDDASALLAGMIAKGPRHAGEWLDLALIECALGHADEAERLFKAIEEHFAPPQGIRDLIGQQRALGCARTKPLSRLNFFAGRGSDGNVNQGASNPSYTLGGTGGATLDLLPAYLPQRDRYTVAALDYLRALGEHGALGFVQLLVRHNDKLSDYNTASLFGGAEQPWQLGNWRLRGTAFGGVLSLGGRLYQEQAQLQLRITPPLTLPSGVELSALTGLSHVHYKTLTNFNSNTVELRAVAAYRGGQSEVQASLGFLNDHAIGLRPGGDRDGWSLALSGRHRFGTHFQGELDLSRQLWRGATAYAAPLIEERRRQDTRIARAVLIRALGEHQSLHLEARHIDNRENISLFRYRDTILQLSWHWAGF